MNISSDDLADMLHRRSKRQTFKQIGAAYGITDHQCHRIVTRELQRKGIFLPRYHNAEHCTHPFFDSIKV